MTHEPTSPERDGAAAPFLGTQVAIGAAALAVLLSGSLLLWARYGEAVYIDRIMSAIANCF